MLNLFFKSSCAHEEISPNMISGYCPDCGEYVENHWYITRCACCGIKQKSIIRKNKIFSYTKYCRNCGSNSFMVEELDKITIVDINYAVVLKQVVEGRKQSFIQTWVERNNCSQMKLLPTF